MDVTAPPRAASRFCVRAVPDLCEVYGRVVRYGLVGQALHDAQHRRGQEFLEELDLLLLAAEGRRTHLSGSLWRQHIKWFL